MNIAQKIKTEKRPVGNLHEKSYFEAVFSDGSVSSEKDTNWSSISKSKIVKFGNNKSKMVYVCTQPIKKLRIYHNELFNEIQIGDGQEVYQAFKNQTAFKSDDGRVLSNVCLGRIMGIVEGDEVVQEYFLDDIAKQIIGFKK